MGWWHQQKSGAASILPTFMGSLLVPRVIPTSAPRGRKVAQADAFWAWPASVHMRPGGKGARVEAQSRTVISRVTLSELMSPTSMASKPGSLLMKANSRLSAPALQSSEDKQVGSGEQVGSSWGCSINEPRGGTLQLLTTQATASLCSRLQGSFQAGGTRWQGKIHQRCPRRCICPSMSAVAHAWTPNQMPRLLPASMRDTNCQREIPKSS